MPDRSILFVIGSLGIGGAERHVTNVAIALKRRGWAPAIFVMSSGGPLSAVLEQNAVPIHAAVIPRWVDNIANDRLRARIGLVMTAWALWMLLWRSRPQVLHFFLPAAYIVGGIVSLFSPVRHKIMSRRSMNHYQANHLLFGKLERRLHPKMSAILANSLAVKNNLVSEGVSPEKIGLIYNGIDIAAFKATKDGQSLRDLEGIQEQTLVMTMVANLIPYKGHKDLLLALGAVKDSLPTGWLLLCVGRDDGIEAELRSLATSLGIADSVRFLGSRTDIANILSLSDIGLLTSHEEGFSNSVLECMAAGVPMIVTDVGGNAEAVVDGVTGVVVPARSPARLGEAVLALLDPEKRAELGERGRERVLNLFSLDACIDQYEDVYCTVAGIEKIDAPSQHATTR